MNKNKKNLLAFLLLVYIFLTAPFKDLESRINFDYFSIDAYSSGLGGGSISYPSSRAAAIFANPALLSGFSKLGFEANFGLLYQDFTLAATDTPLDYDFQPNTFFTGSLTVQYEILNLPEKKSKLDFGFLFSIPKHYQFTLSSDQLKDIISQLNIMPIAREVVKNFLDEMQVENISDFYWVIYEMTPALSYRYDFFSVGLGLHLNVHEFKGVFGEYPKLPLFSMATQLGFAFDLPYVKIGTSLKFPVYFSNYKIKKEEINKTFVNIVNLSAQGQDLGSSENEYEEQGIASPAGLLFNIGLGFDVLPNLLMLFFDYKMTYMGEEVEKNINRYIIAPPELIFDSEKDNRFMHNIIAGILLKRDSFPVDFKMAYNYVHSNSEQTIFPTHILSFGIGVKILEKYFIDLANVIGLPTSSNPQGQENLLLRMSYYKFIIGFRMNIF